MDFAKAIKEIFPKECFIMHDNEEHFVTTNENFTKLYIDDSKFEETYDKLLNALGYEILIKQYDNDYHGDNIYFLHCIENPNQYGYVDLSYGTCSYCDQFKACNTLNDLVSLCEEYDNKMFKGNFEEVVNYILNDHDFEGSCLPARMYQPFKKNVEKYVKTKKEAV